LSGMINAPLTHHEENFMKLLQAAAALAFALIP
jgi:hypothetical protein